MQPDSVHKGRLIKLLTDYSNVPAATWASIDSIGHAWNGTWYFTVRWRPYTPIRGKFPRGMTEYSVNLWEKDLALFEVVSAEEEAASGDSARESQVIRPPLPKLGGGSHARRQGRVDPNQLTLFGTDDFKAKTF